jgi:hypothetical protein
MRWYFILATLWAFSPLISVAMPSTPWPDQSCPESQASQGTFSERIGELKSVILNAVETKVPHAPAIKTKIFTGNYDWHSSVHAHWALLCMARETHDAELKELVLQRLNVSALAYERKLLNKKKNARFEMPYGQSWLLLLLHEMTEAGLGARKDVALLKAETLERVLHWLETSPFPDGDPSANPANPQYFRGDHYSWLFSYWLVQMSAPGPQAKARLEALRLKKIEPLRALLVRNPSVSWDFLSIPAVLALVDLTSGRSNIPEYALDPAVGLNSPLSLSNAHTAGAAMVRIWPHALLSQGSPQSCARYNTRMNEMFSRPDQWRDDFYLVSHWVPQFMWMAIWLQQYPHTW